MVNKREQQREERRAQILNCGLRMIVTRGYEATKIRDIADELGISIGLFFNYFESKEALYVELVKNGLEGPQNILSIPNPQGTPISLFEEMTRAIFTALRYSNQTSLFFLLMTQTNLSDHVPPAIKTLVTDFDMFTPLLPIIKDGQREGYFKQGDPFALVTAYWGAITGIAELRALKPDYPLPEPDWIVDILRK